MSRVIRPVLLALLAGLLPLALWPTAAQAEQQLTLTGPAEVAPEMDITVEGTLTDNGTAVKHADVEMSWKCLNQWEAAFTPLGTFTTNPAGTFDVTTTAGVCSEYLFHAETQGSDGYLYSADLRVRVARVEPTLRISSPDTAVAGDSVPLTVTLTMPDGGPVPDAEVEVELDDPEDTEVRRTVTTGADGTAVVENTLTLEGTYYYRAVFPGTTSLAWTVANVEQVSVAKLGPTLTLEGPDSAQLDETFTLSGSITGPTSPLDLTLTDPEGNTRTVTTSADGTYEVAVTATTGGKRYWRIRYPGDVRYEATTATHVVTVPKQVTDLTVSGPTSVELYDEFTVTGRLSGVDAPAEVLMEGPYDFSHTITTAADGTFDVTTTAYYPLLPGPKTWKFTYAGDSRHEPSSATHEIEVLPLATTLTVDAPASAPLDVPITLTGRLTGADNPARILLTDSLGYRRATDTAADGTFSLQTSPQWVGGPATWTVSYEGDAATAPASTKVTVEIEKIQPAITLRTDRATYTAGERARIFVTMPDSDGEWVIVTAKRESRKSVVLFKGPYPEGGLSLTREMRHTEVIKAVSPESERRERAVSAVTRGVRLVLRTRATERLATSGRYAIYSRSTNPLFESTSEPARPGTCLRHEVQQYRSGSWRTVMTSSCKEQSDLGQVRWRLRGTHPARVGHRVRAVYAGDGLNLASKGRWSYVRFR